jgi:hypothetical protein
MIDMNGWHVDDKLPNGKPVYEMKGGYRIRLAE